MLLKAKTDSIYEVRNLDIQKLLDRERPFMLYLTEEINTNGVDGAQENRKCIL